MYRSYFQSKKDPFMKRLFPLVESLVFYKNRELKQSWYIWDKAPIPVTKAELIKKKVLVFIFWKWIYYKILPSNHTTNSENYFSKLNELKAAIARKSPLINNKRIIIFHYDNSSLHKSLTVQNKPLAFDYDILNHPSFSPNIA